VENFGALPAAHGFQTPRPAALEGSRHFSTRVQGLDREQMAKISLESAASVRGFCVSSALLRRIYSLVRVKEKNGQIEEG
jgi:hypothetical protein